MEISPAATDDLDRIFDLYDQAVAYQKELFHKHWLGFDSANVEREIHEERLWKIVEGDGIACIWSVTFADPVIWGEGSNESAMYIHRIVTADGFHGRGYAKVITSWAHTFATERGLRFIRMDTWSDNRKLIDYYVGCGFRYLGSVAPQESDTMPAHYRGIELALFEIDLHTVRDELPARD